MSAPAEPLHPAIDLTEDAAARYSERARRLAAR
jgi:hypothetical protein